ncbi:glutamic acid-rich protein [Medicago truncatula]|nr:glutamic acid-rich protein-like [Medicago truncatula]
MEMKRDAVESNTNDFELQRVGNEDSLGFERAAEEEDEDYECERVEDSLIEEANEDNEREIVEDSMDFERVVVEEDEDYECERVEDSLIEEEDEDGDNEREIVEDSMDFERVVEEEDEDYEDSLTEEEDENDFGLDFELVAVEEYEGLQEEEKREVVEAMLKIYLPILY